MTFKPTVQERCRYGKWHYKSMALKFTYKIGDTQSPPQARNTFRRQSTYSQHPLASHYSDMIDYRGLGQADEQTGRIDVALEEINARHYSDGAPRLLAVT
jgi:hypothetical protein